MSEHEKDDESLGRLRRNLRKYPSRPHVGVGAVIIFNKKLLLVKRKYDPDAGKWAIPGGHLKLGEKAKNGIKREVLEETGIKVKIKGIAGVIDKIMHDNDQRILFHYVLVNYETQIVDERFKDGIPELKAMDDAADLKFVKFKDIPQYQITDSLTELLHKMDIL